jgi:hypothetical protein
MVWVWRSDDRGRLISEFEGNGGGESPQADGTGDGGTMRDNFRDSQPFCFYVLSGFEREPEFRMVRNRLEIWLS